MKPRPTRLWARSRLAWASCRSAWATSIWAASCGGLLRLDAAVDHRQHLAGADPLAGLDEDADDLAALARHADRHVVARGERAGRGDDPVDLLPARGGDGHGGELLALVGDWAPRPSRRVRRAS